MTTLEMRGNDTPGTLITLCGLDGCGKTTIIKMLSEYLRSLGKELFLTKQPTDFVRQTAIFRTYMDQPDHDPFDYRCLSLIAAGDRIQHSSRVIYPELQKGKYVISDRYIYSCVANLRARGYTQDQWIYEIVKYIPKPDLAFFLDVPVDTAVKRVRSRPEERDKYIDMDLQYKLRGEYLNLANTNGGVVLTSEDAPEETFKAVKKHVIAYMEANNEYI